MFFDIFECGWSARCPYGKPASENALHKMMLATVKTLGNSLAELLRSFSTASTHRHCLYVRGIRLLSLPSSQLQP